MFIFQFLNGRIHNYVKKTSQLSKTNIFFSCFEGMRGEKIKCFAPYLLTTDSKAPSYKFSYEAPLIRKISLKT